MSKQMTQAETFFLEVLKAISAKASKGEGIKSLSEMKVIFEDNSELSLEVATSELNLKVTK